MFRVLERMRIYLLALRVQCRTNERNLQGKSNNYESLDWQHKHTCLLVLQVQYHTNEPYRLGMSSNLVLELQWLL
jgi:hypothetical protein